MIPRLGIALVVLFFGTIMFRAAAGNLSLRYPNIISLTYYHLLLFQLIGASLLFSGAITNNWWVNQATHPQQSVFYAFMATSFSVVFLPLAIYFFIRLLGTSPWRSSLIAYQRPVHYINGCSDSLASPLLALLLLLVLAGAYFIITSLKTVPLVQLLIGTDAQALAVYRRQSSNLPFALRIAHNVLTGWISPILTLVAYGYAIKSRKLRHIFIFGLFLAVTSLLLVYRLEKAPIIRFIAMIIIARGMYGRGLRWRTLLISFIIGSSALVGMYLLIMGAKGAVEAVSSIISRVLVAQHAGLVLSFDYYPSKEPFIGGYSFLPFSSKLFGEQLTESFALRLMRFYNPIGWLRGAAGYTATLFVAEAFANWGIIGIILGNIIIAAFLAACFHWFTRVDYNPVSIAAIAYLSLQVPTMINCGLRFAVYSPELLVSLILLLLFVLTVRGRAVLRLRRKSQIVFIHVVLPSKKA